MNFSSGPHPHPEAPHLGPPEKKVRDSNFPGKGCNQRDPHNTLSGIGSLGSNRGVPNGLFSATKITTSVEQFRVKIIKRQSFVIMTRNRNFPKITATVDRLETRMKFQASQIKFITVLAPAVTPSFPLIPNYRTRKSCELISSKLPLTVLKCFWII